MSEFTHPAVRWLLKGWFFASAFAFAYLFSIDVFVHRWFILLWSVFSFALGVYVAPVIRVGREALGVKYLWRYRRIPWHRVLDVQRTLLGVQILTTEANWVYRVVGYQYPLPGVSDLTSAVRLAMREGGGRA